jgi:hypothetical protein
VLASQADRLPWLACALDASDHNAVLQLKLTYIYSTSTAALLECCRGCEWSEQWQLLVKLGAAAAAAALSQPPFLRVSSLRRHVLGCCNMLQKPHSS